VPRRGTEHLKGDPRAVLLAEQVIGAAIEVHRHLGPGHGESVYEEALAHEMALRAIPNLRQHPFELRYKDHPVGTSRLDFLVAGLLVVELKSVDDLLPVHNAQVIGYLRALNLEVGLLLNFKVSRLTNGVRRIISSQSSVPPPSLRPSVAAVEKAP
jgi:GxxExxY protein